METDHGSDVFYSSFLQELRDIGVKTVWGEPSDLGAAVGGSSFDVVLDNNGKTLDVVQYVSHQGVSCFGY